MEANSYLNQLRTLHRIFRITRGSAFLFATIRDEKLQKEINQNLVEIAGQYQNTIVKLDVSQNPNWPFSRKVEEAIRGFDKLGGLIMNQLPKTYEKKSGILLEINMFRERLIELEIPILFWVTPELLPDLIRVAKDLYSQRAISTFDFSPYRTQWNEIRIESKSEAGQVDENRDTYSSDVKIEIGLNPDPSFDPNRSSDDIFLMASRLSWLEETLQTEEKKGEISSKSLKELIAPLLDLYQKIPGYQAHVKSILNKYASKLEDVGLFVILGNAWSTIGNWDKAEYFFRMALEKITKWDIPENLAIGYIHFELGLIALKKSKREEARIELNGCIRLLEKLDENLFEKWEKLGSAYANLGILFTEINQPKQAEESYVNALRCFKPKSESFAFRLRNNYANVLNLYGTFSVFQNQWKKGEGLLIESIQILRDSVKKNAQLNRPELADALNNLAIIYRQTGRIVEALEIHKEAVELKRRMVELDPSYWRLLCQGLNNLGGVYFELQQLNEAEKCFIEALKLYRKHPDADMGGYEEGPASLLHNLSNFYYAKNPPEISRSLEYFKEAESIYRELVRKYPKVHLKNLAGLLGNQGSIYAQNQQLGDAEKALNEAFELYKTLITEDLNQFSIPYARAASNLGLFYQNKREDLKARDFYITCIQTVKPFLQVHPEGQELSDTALRRLRRLGFVNEANSLMDQDPNQ